MTFATGLPQFLTYAVIGVFNTLIHWGIFGGLYGLAGMSQAFANLLAFLCAVTVSFFLNARLTFSDRVSVLRYLGYVMFLGLIAWGTGRAADAGGLHPLVSLAAFSMISLGLGFLWSRYVIFTGGEQP